MTHDDDRVAVEGAPPGPPLATDESAADQCRCCETLLADVPRESGLCQECEALVIAETARVFRELGSFERLGTPRQVGDAKQSLRVLYASTFIGTSADKLARFLGISRSATRGYGVRFREAGIWENDGVHGPWESRVWLSPPFCRMLFMDALVGAGLAERRKRRWVFINSLG